MALPRAAHGAEAQPVRARHGAGVASWLLCGAAPVPPPPSPAIQRATAAVSTGLPRSRFSLFALCACLLSRLWPLHLPCPGLSPLSLPDRERQQRGWAPCVGNRLLGAMQGGGHHGDKHLRSEGWAEMFLLITHAPSLPWVKHPPFIPPFPALLGSLYGNHEMARWKNLLSSHSGSRVCAEFQGVCVGGEGSDSIYGAWCPLPYICAVSSHSRLWLIKTYFLMYS
ncbi:uncharacterized protein LOC133268521 isoform X1 [Pezoporus flaviventris]|uniref:uncharacterized protein LOC133268521 isoform X1 n=1 Tax=Pezoporus flaviventris TaxID=889875 RepID=UPI002AB11E74|nr:uncharacterized protein LOC133268521 isoform X1 [Pezoporus flaviventris]